MGYELWKSAKPEVLEADLIGIKRPELIQWAKQRYPTLSGKAWLKATNEEVRHCLAVETKSGDWGEAPDAVIAQHRAWKDGNGGMEPGSGKGAPKVKRETIGDKTPGAKAKAKPKAEPKVSSDSAAAALEILLSSLKGKDGEAGVTEEQVRALVRAELSDSRPKVLKIEHPERDPVVVEGQHRDFARLLDAIDLRDPVILTGPPGTGKSYAANAAATVLSMDYGEISVGPTMTESRLLGYQDATGRYVKTQFRARYEEGGVFLLDEADNGSGAVIAVLNNAMANARCAFPDKLIDMHEDFVLVVAANTVGHGATREYLGRQGFDGPFRDRLTFIDWQIDEVLERNMAHAAAVSYGVMSEQAEDWITTVRKIRTAIEVTGQVRVVASPRSVVKGIMYLGKGWGKDEVLEAVLWKQASPDIRKKITKAVE